MVKQDNNVDIVGSAFALGINNASYGYNPLGKIRKVVSSGYLVAYLGLICLLTACEQVVSTTTSSKVSTIKPASTFTVPKKPASITTCTPTASTELFTVSFQAFHDYNGNGTKQEGEPILEGILFKTSTGECTTGADGTCQIDKLPAGDYNIFVIDFRDVESFEKLRYILPTSKTRIDINKPIPISVPTQNHLDIPLALGSLVLPFPIEVKYEIGSWFDEDFRTGYVKDWKGNSDNAVKVPHTDALFSSKLRIEDGHYAIDWIFENKTPILACDAGTIVKLVRDTTQVSKDDYIILIKTSYGLVFDYGHVKPIDGISTGQQVDRGQLLGYSFSHIYPPPFDRYTSNMFHVGFYPTNCNEYSCSLDPFPNLWTTLDFDRARVSE